MSLPGTENFLFIIYIYSLGGTNILPRNNSYLLFHTCNVPLPRFWCITHLVHMPTVVGYSGNADVDITCWGCITGSHKSFKSKIVDELIKMTMWPS